MPHGGVLEIETYTLLTEARAWTVLSITDSGVGMEPALQARAFEPYFTTRESGVGVGLGLATVAGFVRRSGGHLEARSRPGCGTIVTIYLPHA
jgi:signal transduction histidine kinase